MKKRPAKSGTNLRRVGNYNLLVVLDQIRRARGGVSRVEIAKSTGLSAQTVTNVVNKLMELHLVSVGERVYRENVRGKPPTLLHVDPLGGYSVGIHVDPANLSFGLMNVAGELIETRRFAFPKDPEPTLALIGEQVRDLTAGLPSERVLGVGCSVPGSIALGAGKFMQPPTLPGWDQLPFRDLVAKETGLPAFMQKDSIAALSAEIWRRNRGVERTTLFVYSGFGIGLAAAHEGELLVGSTGNAGGAGHIKVGMDSDRCSCGRTGCVGKIMEFAYLVDQATESGVLAEVSSKRTDSELEQAMDELSSLARMGNQAAVEILDRAVQALARASIVIADFLDATEIVIGGSNTPRIGEQLMRAIEEEYDSFSVGKRVHGLEVYEADFGAWVGAAGGASLVFDALLSPRPAMLTV